MASWVWWVIWPSLIVASLMFIGYIAYDLMSKASRVVTALTATEKLARGLVEASQRTPELPEFNGNLLDDPAPLVAEHQRNLKKRELKRLARQRRLINKLIDYDESEFKP